MYGMNQMSGCGEGGTIRRYNCDNCKHLSARTRGCRSNLGRETAGFGWIE